MITRMVLTAVLTATLGGGLLSAATALPYKVVIDKEGPEEAAFDTIKTALTEAKVDQALATVAFKGFDRYIDHRIGDRKKVTLYPQTIFEITKTAAAKKWPGVEIGDLLIHIQKEIDEEDGSGTKLKRLAVAEIEKGKKLPAVIDALEASEGAADDDKP
ncbi:MAG: hypothetical protein ABI779_05575 [Acidobacteriota bacterium]